jgi:hypothetical protein
MSDNPADALYYFNGITMKQSLHLAGWRRAMTVRMQLTLHVPGWHYAITVSGDTRADGLQPKTEDDLAGFINGEARPENLAQAALSPVAAMAPLPNATRLTEPTTRHR